MIATLVIAATEHGPGRHGVIAVVLVAIAVIGGLAYLARRVRK